MDLKIQVRKVLGKNYRASNLTNMKNIGNVNRFCDALQSKYGLEKINHLKSKHINGVFDDLRAVGVVNSTLAGYATAARKIAYAIGKQNIVPRKNKDLGISRAGERLRPVKADLVKIDSIREQLYREGEWLGLASDLRKEFGLRAKESLLSSRVDNGRLVVEGSKGGRPRSIKINTEAQHKVVNKVQEYILLKGQKSLCPKDLNLKQSYQKQANALHKLGATKASCAHAHAQRHAYAQDQISRGESRKHVAENLGHGRVDVVKHYVSG